MYQYGFELEGFFTDSHNNIILPPKGYPTDGFPGLVELRTTGRSDLDKALSSIIQKMYLGPLDWNPVLWGVSEYTFPRELKGELRRRWSNKTAWDIRNLYGKPPRYLGNKTIASLQINISYLVSEERSDKDGKYWPPIFKQLDVPRIVKSLDEEFKTEIKESKRQPGEYCIKGDRLEYRSLPNSVWPSNDPYSWAYFRDRIKKSVEE